MAQLQQLARVHQGVGCLRMFCVVWLVRWVGSCGQGFCIHEVSPRRHEQLKGQELWQWVFVLAVGVVGCSIYSPVQVFVGAPWASRCHV